MQKRRNTLYYARVYTRRGWHVVPIPPQEKGPRLKRWQQLRLVESQLPEYFNRRTNIGVLLGRGSRGLTDVDLDCVETIFLAKRFLPPTERIHGRKSKPASHYFYYTDPVADSQKFCDLDGTSLVELRSSGLQTVVPPSIHPSGEKIRWESSKTPSRVARTKLRRRVAFLAAASLIARHWPNKGSRNQASLALAGMLLRAGWKVARVEHFIANVARAAGDDEWRSRKAAARTTRKRFDSDTPATGIPKLISLLGRAVVDRASEWLGISAERPVHRTNRTRAGTWPRALSQRAFQGLAGEVVRAIAPHTEADEAALLLQLLVLFGNVIGRKPQHFVGAQPHHTNLFAIIVGQTSRGRKGTALAEVKRFFHAEAGEWLKTRIQAGLSSGEGLIWAVRDPAERMEPEPKSKPRIGRTRKHDPGVTDKRLLVVETEFAAPLRIMKREGNTLSAILRMAWDQGDLNNLTKNSPVRATGAHISVVGHVTRDELRRELSSNESFNGFANRFLWGCAARSRLLPFGGHIDSQTQLLLQVRLRQAIRFARCAGDLEFSDKARKLWKRRYLRLTADGPGLFGAVTSRSEAQVLRLAIIYALLERSVAIKSQHLKAAFAVWRYCRDSARYIFGNSTGDVLADHIMVRLRMTPEGLTRTEIRELFSRNKTEAQIEQALALLAENGFAVSLHEATGGRPAERWRLAQ